MAACCRSATQCFWVTRGTSRRMRWRAGGCPPGFGFSPAPPPSPARGLITGVVAIRRQGIYFAMITLALSQLLYFIYLQVPFTHGEDGIQGIPQGYLFGIFNLARPTV